jgi:hypothetical protein
VPDSPDRVELTGGPLDGDVLDLSALTPAERGEGVALPAPGATDPGGRSLYGPDPHNAARWRYEGDLP